MIARIRHALTRARAIGFSQGYRAGIEEASGVHLPPEVIAAYWDAKSASEAGLVSWRNAQARLEAVLAKIIEGEKE